MAMSVPEVFVVYKAGLLYAEICTNIKSKDRIEKLANTASGLSETFGKDWKICADLIYNSEEAVKTAMEQDIFTPFPPMLCEKIHYTHKHYILQCYNSNHSQNIHPKPKKIVEYIPRILPPPPK